MQEHRRGPELRGRAPEHRDHDAACRHRRHPARRRPVSARADQRSPARQDGRSDRALGRQGHHGRDPRDHPSARRPGRDEPAAVRGAHAACRHHRVGGRAPIGDQRRRGHEAGRDPGAEGDRQAAILRAEGFALALEQIYGAASKVDQKTMALQYLEAFKALGASPSTKYVLPMEITAPPNRSAGSSRPRTKTVRRSPAQHDHPGTAAAANDAMSG